MRLWLEMRRKMPMAALVSAALAAWMPSTVRSAESGRTLGFVLTDFAPAHNPGPGDCPQGPAQTPQQMYLATTSLPEDERRRLLLPENGRELTGRAIRGPKGEDLCRVPEAVTHPPIHTVESKIGVGLDLDGAADGQAPPGTCAHESFTSPAGERGIDNQQYRAIGCIGFYRQGDYARLINSFMTGGEFTILIEITGVDDLRNDDAVEIGIYNSKDPVFTDAAGKVLPHASLRIADGAKSPNVLHGHIKDGVLTTEPGEIRLGFSQAAAPAEYIFKAARFRLELDGESGLKGLMGGYRTLANIQGGGSSAGAGAVIGMDCPGYQAALRLLADGFPDPETGKCTAISVAHHVEGIPAFVIHPKPVATSRSADAALQ
jgi:hypothetical protein